MYGTDDTGDEDEMLDLELARLPSSMARPSPAARDALPRPAEGERYLGGPIPISWLSAACRLSGRSLQVAIAVWHEATLSGRTAQAPVRASLCRQFGVSRSTMARGLDQLVAAGLLEVVARGRGRLTIVRICSAPPSKRSIDN